MSNGDATLLDRSESEVATKRVLVTGGTKGMGEAIVQRLTAGGATVATAIAVGYPHELNSSSGQREVMTGGRFDQQWILTGNPS